MKLSKFFRIFFNEQPLIAFAQLTGRSQKQLQLVLKQHQ